LHSLAPEGGHFQPLVVEYDKPVAAR